MDAKASKTSERFEAMMYTDELVCVEGEWFTFWLSCARTAMAAFADYNDGLTGADGEDDDTTIAKAAFDQADAMIIEARRRLEDE